MRFVTCRLPDGMEDPAILSQDGTQVWPLSWLGLSYETLSDAIPFLTPQVRFGLQLAISGIPALPVEAVTLQSPIPCPAQDVVCLGINYMAHSDEAEKYSADAFSTPASGRHLLLQAGQPRGTGRRLHRGAHRPCTEAGLRV